MSIDKDILWEKIETTLRPVLNKDWSLAKELIQKIIYNHPTKNCIIK
jgi:hypothetical protein